MSKKRTEKPTIVAASPMVHESGMLPYRIVIRDLGDQLVVHTEVFEPDKEPWYHQGDYFPKRSDAPTAEESDAAALRKAWARFEERVRRSLRMDPPPAKRLAEVSDIAETIIKTLSARRRGRLPGPHQRRLSAQVGHRDVRALHRQE